MGGRIEIQAQDRRRLGFEVGVGTGDVVVELMRLEPMAPPEPADEALRDPMALGHDPAGPVSPCGWGTPLRLGENAGLRSEGNPLGPSRPRSVGQPFVAVLEKPAFPVLDYPRGQPYVLSRGPHRVALGEQQDRAGTSCQPGFDGARTDERFEGAATARREPESGKFCHTWSLA